MHDCDSISNEFQILGAVCLGLLRAEMYFTTDEDEEVCYTDVWFYSTDHGTEFRKDLGKFYFCMPVGTGYNVDINLS
jgi:hypothetical protein